MLISFVSSILNVLYNIMKLGNDLLLKYELYKRNKNTKDRYKEGRKIVRDGNVDKINDIFKGR